MSREARETVLFLAGLAAFAYVLLNPAARDVSILILIAGMLGVPAVLPVDRKRNDETLRENLSGDDAVSRSGDVGGAAGQGA